MKAIFCFGELLLRLSPVLQRQWIHTANIPVFIGGAELNVATALAKWGHPVKYGTCLPDNYMSKDIVEEIQSKGIDISAVHFSGNRIGTYYLPQGTDLKSTGVIYDRAESSFSQLKPGMIDWDKALEGCSWFHFSAISPALNENVAAVCKEALEVASAKKLKISVDLNYRSKLWQYGKQPTEIMPDLVKHCHVIMGNIWAAESLLGINSSIKDSESATSTELVKGAEQSILKIMKQYPLVKTLAYTFRMPDRYYAMIYHKELWALSKQFKIENIIDKVGSGDCFMAALIFAIENNKNPKDIIDFAASAACGKLYEKGDATNQTIDLINSRIQS